MNTGIVYLSSCPWTGNGITRLTASGVSVRAVTAATVPPNRYEVSRARQFRRSSDGASNSTPAKA